MPESSHPEPVPPQPQKPLIKCPFMRAVQPRTDNFWNFRTDIGFLGAFSSWAATFFVALTAGHLQRMGGLQFDGLVDLTRLDQVPHLSHSNDLLSTLEESQLRAYLQGRANRNGCGRVKYTDILELKAKLAQPGVPGTASNMEAGLLFHLTTGGNDDSSGLATVESIMSATYGTAAEVPLPQTELNSIPLLFRAIALTFHNPAVPAADWPPPSAP